MVEFSPEGGSLYRLGFAGDTFNTAWAARLLLLPAVGLAYVTAVGTDWMSEAMLSFMSGAGVETRFVQRMPDLGPGLYATRILEGERTFAYWRADSAATRLGGDPRLLADAFEGADCLFVSGITLAILTDDGRVNVLAAMQAAHARVTLIAFDPNYRSGLWPSREAARAVFERGYALTDVALPSFQDEADLFGDLSPAETAERLWAHGVREIVVKDGAQPALCRGRGGSFEAAPETVPSVIDTSGAGDAFNAGYLAGRVMGNGPRSAMAEGHRVAPIAVQARGALIPAHAVSSSAAPACGRCWIVEALINRSRIALRPARYCRQPRDLPCSRITVSPLCR